MQLMWIGQSGADIFITHKKQQKAEEKPAKIRLCIKGKIKNFSVVYNKTEKFILPVVSFA
jgi:hypothetical protein